MLPRPFSALWLFLTLLTSCGHEKQNNPPQGEATQLSKEDGEAPPPLPGVSSKQGLFRVQVEWQAGPGFAKESKFESRAKIVFLSSDGQPCPTCRPLKIWPWMKIHTHGTGKVKPRWKQVPDELGAYLVSNIKFTMTGPWELMIEAELEGRKDTLEWVLSVPELSANLP